MSAHRAIAHVAARAALAADDARSAIARVLARAGQPDDSTHALTWTLFAHARVTLNFHPDRLCPNGSTVAEGLLEDGRYRSQFVTGVTNGSPTAFPGGDRDRWEEALFGGAYHGTSGAIEERPKYGAFNVMSHADGGSPRFGSCYFELAPTTFSRCTFTWGDSYGQPEHFGTQSSFDAVLAAWLGAVDTNGTALGCSGLSVPAILPMVLDRSRARHDRGRPPGRALDDYVEAHVHGPIELARDVEALVIDPAFVGTETGATLEAIATRYGIALRSHAGFVLSPEEVPDDFRGPRMAPLARRIAHGTTFDADTLGQAARSLARDPDAWRDWAPPAETWQHIKQLWHVLVAFGRARAI